MSAMNYLGLDPGGLNNFGWACLRIGESGRSLDLITGLASNAADAINGASGAATGAPVGVGIDAPLFWVATGDRNADVRVRKLVKAAGGHSSTVAHVNSLRGACLVQGVLAAQIAALKWPSAVITEAHPKALYCIDHAAQEFITRNFPDAPTDHERDAALAAFSAWAAVERFSSWHDLVEEEATPFFPSGQVVSYWFPCRSA